MTHLRRKVGTSTFIGCAVVHCSEIGSATSALGQERLISLQHNRSALPPESRHPSGVHLRRFVPKGDICSAAKVPHSITSSAATRSASGTVRSSALAVLRLMTSRYIVGC